MESGEGAGEAGCSLATLVPGGGGGEDGGEDGGQDGGEHVGDDHGLEFDYQIIPDCELVSTIMSINSRLQVKHLVMFACLDTLHRSLDVRS